MKNTFEILDDVLNMSHDGKPYYVNFPVEKYQYDLKAGSMPASDVLISLVTQVNPSLIIEIGTYLGYSSICMGNTLKAKNLDFRIICVDTWLGSAEHYDFLKERNLDDYGYVNGYPTMYHRFVYNVIKSGLEKNIIPLPFTSKAASIILNTKIKDKIELKADMIYVDGSHEDIDVYFDCKNYWTLLREGGLMFGDDWTWDGVRSGVFTFLEEFGFTNKLQLHPNGVHWFVRK